MDNSCPYLHDTDIKLILKDILSIYFSYSENL